MPGSRPRRCWARLQGERVRVGVSHGITGIPGMATGSPAWIWDPRHSCGISAMDNRICTVTRSPKQPQHPRHGYGIPGMVARSLAWLWDSWWSYSISGTARTPAMDKSIRAMARTPKQPRHHRRGHGTPGVVTGSTAHPRHPSRSQQHPRHGCAPKTPTASPAPPGSRHGPGTTAAPPARPRPPRAPPTHTRR